MRQVNIKHLASRLASYYVLTIFFRLLHTSSDCVENQLKDSQEKFKKPELLGWNAGDLSAYHLSPRFFADGLSDLQTFQLCKSPPKDGIHRRPPCLWGYHKLPQPEGRVIHLVNTLLGETCLGS